MVAGKLGLVGVAHQAQFAQIDAARDVIARDALHRAVQVDWLVVPGRADQRDHALRLAERIGADEMRALGKQRDRAQQLGDLGARIAVAEHRQAERRLGDEGVARISSNGAQVGSGTSL